MRKALILTGFDPLKFTGGIETFSRALVAALEDFHISAETVCAANFSNRSSLHNDFLGQVYAAGQSLLSFDPAEYDFIVSNGYYGGGYFPKRLKTFVIFHSTHAGYAEAIKGLVPLSAYLEIRHIIGDLLEQSSAAGAEIIAVSEGVKSELQKYYGLETVEVVPNPVDTDFFFRLPEKEELRTRYGLDVSRKIGLFVGRWETPKGSDIIAELIKDLRDIFWVIAAPPGGGEAPPEAENVRFLTGLDMTQMREIYSLSDFMVFPSRYEGFGLAAAEAMACGLPVIGSQAGFLADVYSQEPFSALSLPLLLNGGLPDVEEAAPAVREKIGVLMSDDRVCREVSEKGRDIIAGRYNTALWKDRIKKVLCLN